MNFEEAFADEIQKLADIKGVPLGRQVPKEIYPELRSKMAKTVSSMRKSLGPEGRSEAAGRLGTMRTSGWAQKGMREDKPQPQASASPFKQVATKIMAFHGPKPSPAATT